MINEVNNTGNISGTPSTSLNLDSTGSERLNTLLSSLSSHRPSPQTEHTISANDVANVISRRGNVNVIGPNGQPLVTSRNAYANYVIEGNSSSASDSTTASPQATNSNTSEASTSSPSQSTSQSEDNRRNSIGGAIGNGISSIFQTGGNIIGGVIGGIGRGAINFINSAVVQPAKQAFNTIKEATKPIWKPVENVVKSIGRGIKKLFGG